MKREFIDYDGPTRAFIATDRGILPLTSPEAMSMAIDSAMLVSLGHFERAAEYQRLIESARGSSREPSRRAEAKSRRPANRAQRRQRIPRAIKLHAETLCRLGE